VQKNDKERGRRSWSPDWLMDYFEDRLKSKGGGEFEKSGTCMGFIYVK
jgi:hypothetical protein